MFAIIMRERQRERERRTYIERRIRELRAELRAMNAAPLEEPDAADFPRRGSYADPVVQFPDRTAPA